MAVLYTERQVVTKRGEQTPIARQNGRRVLRRAQDEVLSSWHSSIPFSIFLILSRSKDAIWFCSKGAGKRARSLDKVPSSVCFARFFPPSGNSSRCTLIEL